jgi:phosphoribosylamine--glycine ligase
MNVLVIGSGGREHALTWKLRQSSGVDRIFCAPGNAGTAEIAENVPLAANDLSGLLDFARQNKIGLTVVGPDDPLAAGIVDLFLAAKLRIFGPAKNAAQLEASKVWAKEVMQKSGIPTAASGAFANSADALRFCDGRSYPVVVKADGLALGKGVIVAESREDAAAAIRAMIDEERFGTAGKRILIEEFLTGPECSLHALVDGKNYRLLATARDHKRACDGDEGPNTGGMGAFSPADRWTASDEAHFHTKIMRPLLDELRERDVDFRGLLFPGLMMTADGAKVLEFNCRFGDPETQAILPRLRSDLLSLLEATIDGNLADAEIGWDARPAVTVVMASGGYPGSYEIGKPISGLEDAAALEDVHVFHAGTRLERGEIVTSGGRVLAVTALGDDIAKARTRAYDAVSKIHFEGCHFRRDIALSAVAASVGKEAPHVPPDR